MELARLLLGLAGLTLILRYGEGEFAGSAEDASRRKKLRRLGIALVLAGLALGAWSHFA